MSLEVLYDDFEVDSNIDLLDKSDEYCDVKDIIESRINLGIMVIGSLHHNYAGYACYKNVNNQILGVYETLQDFIDNSLNMGNADYVKIFNKYDKLFIKTACHDYSTQMEIKQISDLTHEINQNYGFDDFMGNYPQKINNLELYCYDFYGKQYHVEYQNKIIDNVWYLEDLCFEDRLDMVLNDKKPSEVL